MALDLPHKSLDRLAHGAFSQITKLIPRTRCADLLQIMLRHSRTYAPLYFQKAGKINVVELFLLRSELPGNRRGPPNIADVVGSFCADVDKYGFTCLHLPVKMVIIAPQR